MNVDVNLVEQLVKKVLDQVEGAGDLLTTAGDCGVFETMDDAINAAEAGQRQYLKCSMADRAKYVQTIRDVVLRKDVMEYISRQAVEETGMGGYEYKVIKNTLAATKTPGVEDLTTEALSGDDGLTLVEYSPFGVIGSITPTTNPTETVICNSIGMLAAGNAVVFSPHPRAKNVTLYLIKAINRALKEAGAPDNLVVTVAEPSIENTNAMMKHPKVRMLVATGGPGIVKTVLSSGKKAIGAGAGKRTAALITDMNQPLGRTAGNAIEVVEAVETLHGNGPVDLTELCIHLAGNMLWLAEKGELPDCLAMAKATLANGSAFQKLRAMVQRQGGDVFYLDHPEKLPCAPAYAVQAEQDGFVAAMQTEEIGAVAGMLGAGRERKEDKVDPAAGIRFVKKIGEPVQRGETLAFLYTNRPDQVAQASERYRDAVRISSTPPAERRLILARVCKE